MTQNNDKITKWKVKQSKEFTRDLDKIPEEDKEEVFDELDKLMKGFKDGTINPGEVGEPIDMEKLRKEEPEIFDKLIKRAKELHK